MKVWRIDDYAVLYLLHVNDYRCERLGSGDYWRIEPGIEIDGCIELPGGFVIEVVNGVELRATKKDEVSNE